MSRFSRWLMACILCLVMSWSALAQSAYISLTGDFPTAGDQHECYFDLIRPVGSGEELRFQTYANGGGTNAARRVIPAGGIDSVLELTEFFFSTPHGYDDDGSFTPGLDSLLSWPGVGEPLPSGDPLYPDPLGAATYRLNLSEYGNNAVGHWALDLIGPADALVLRNDTPSGTSRLDELVAGGGAQVHFEGAYELNGGRNFTFYSGSSLTVDEYLDIGNGTNGSLFMEHLGTSLTTNTTASTFLDWGFDGGVANITINDRATANIQASSIYLARDSNSVSTGALSVIGAGEMTMNSLFVGTGSGLGAVVVRGAGSSITQNDASMLTIGDDAILGPTDELLVEDGGIFSSGRGPIKLNPTASLSVNNATFNANGTMTIATTGSFGFYGVLLQNQGRINSQDVQIGTDTKHGAALINGATVGPGLRATWDVTGTMTVGSENLGYGNLTVEEAGRLQVSKNLEIASSGSSHGTLSVQSDGAVTVDNTVTVHGSPALDHGVVNLLDGTIKAGSFLVQHGGVFNHENGTLTVDGGTYDPYDVNYWIDGSSPSAMPIVQLDHGATLHLTSASVRVGNTARGRLEVLNGSQAIFPSGNTTVVASAMGSEGWLIVDGAGSRANNWGGHAIGARGNGTLRVSSGGTVDSLGSSSPSFIYDEVGGEIGSRGVAEILGTAPAGTPSSWVTVGELLVGRKGLGTLSILAGGRVESQNGAAIATDSGSGGSSVAIDGTGPLAPSRWDVTGSLYVGGDSSRAGANGNLDVQNGGQADVGDTLKVWPTGAVQLSGSDSEIRTGSFLVELGGTFSQFGGTLTVDGGTFDPGLTDYVLNGDSSGNPSIVRLINGATASLPGAVVLISNGHPASLEVLSGSQVNLSDPNSFLEIRGSSSGSGRVTVDGNDSHLTTPYGLSIDGQGAPAILQILNGGRVSDALSSDEQIALFGGEGIVEISGKAPDGAPATWDSHGKLNIGYNGLGTLNVSAGANALSAGGAIALQSGSAGSSATVSDLGSLWHMNGPLFVGGSSTGAGDLGSLRIANDGQVVAQDTTIWASGQLELDDGILSTGNLQVEGRLSGIGAIVLGPGDVLTNSGAVSPGLSAGVLTISSGDYVQTTGGVLAVEISGTSAAQFDRLYIVTGTSTLAGTLEVSLIDPLGGSNLFVPSAGDTFEILTAGELMGTFSSELFPTIPGKPGLSFLIDYNTMLDRVLLSVAPVFEADFDEDLDVDADDLAIWQAGYGSGMLHTDGDADGGGNVDGNDFLIWQRQLGSGGGGSLVAVPEPATWIMLIMGISTYMSCPGTSRIRDQSISKHLFSPLHAN